MRYKGFLIDIILSALIPLAVASYLLKDIVFPLDGFIFYGDVLIYMEFGLKDFVDFCLYTWKIGEGASAGYLSLLPYFIYATLGQIFGYQLEVRIQILLLAALPSTSMYFAVKILSKRWFPRVIENSPKKLYFISFIAGLLYGFNYVNSNLTDPLGAAGLQYAYIFLPIIFAFFVEYLHEGSFKYLLILGIFSMFVAISPIWVVFFPVLAVGYLVFLLIFKRHERLSLVRRAFLLGIFLILLNMFWILPTLAAYLLGASGPFQEYQPAKRLSFEGMKAMYRLLDSIMFGHKTYYLFGMWPQNWNLVNIVIPILAFLTILLAKNKYVIYLIILATASTFLLKATNPPFGSLYYWLALHLPYGVGAVLANYSTWAYIQAFSYFFLISLILLILIKKGVKRRLYTVVAVILMLAVFYSTINGLYIDSQVYLPRFKPQDIPQVYYDVNNWLEQQPLDLKVLWIPSGGVPFWKGYIVTAFPETISKRTPVSGNLVLQALNRGESLEKVTTLLGIKYIIYHDDILESDEQLYKALSESKDFRRVALFTGNFKVKDNFNSPHSLLSLTKEYNGIDVELVEPKNLTLVRGEKYILKIRYHIPQEIIRMLDYQSIKSSRIWVFEAGSEFDPSRILYHHIGPTNLVTFNETDGILEFPLIINERYNGNAIDVYIDFYGSAFTRVTPLIYIGRFKVEPDYIQINVTVFENLGYKGSLFVNPTEAGKVIYYKRISPVEWEVIINASEPFILTFTEPYDRLWRAYVDGEAIDSIPLYGLVNGFVINKTGIIHIKIYYTLQTYYVAGMLVSLFTFISLAFILMAKGINAERSSLNRSLLAF